MGWADGDPQFQSIQSGQIRTSGQVVVGDGGTNLIHVLSPLGASLTVMGGEGEGPGEFVSIGTVLALGADTVFVSDSRNLRVTIFSGAEQVSETRFEAFLGGAIYQPSGRSDDDTYILKPAAFALRRGEEPGWRSYPIFRTSDFASMDTITSLPLMYFPEPGDMNPVRNHGAVVQTARQIAHLLSDRPEITWIDAHGVVTQIARWDAPPQMVGEEHWSAYEHGVRERADPASDQQAFEQRLDDRRRDFGGPIPLFRAAHGDREGNVWLGQYDFGGFSSSVYLVVSSEGELIGPVAFPRDIGVLDITDSHVLGVELDEFDVEAVVLYALDK